MDDEDDDGQEFARRMARANHTVRVGIGFMREVIKLHPSPEVRRMAIAALLEIRRRGLESMPLVIRTLVEGAYVEGDDPAFVPIRNDARETLVGMGVLTEGELGLLSEDGALAVALDRYRVWDETGEMPA